MKIKDAIHVIEQFAPLSLQESYDNAGLICGNYDDSISSVLLTTDITEDVLDEAISGGHNFIIAHHPLIFHGLKNILPNNYIKRSIIKAIKYNINIYAAHTNMDAVLHGVNYKIAQKIGLTNCSILEPKGKLYSLTFYTPRKQSAYVTNAILELGGGHIGNYSHCSFNSDGLGTFKALEGANPFVGKVNQLHNENEIKTEITVPDYLLQSCISTLKTVHPYEEPVYNIVCINNSNPITGNGLIGELSSPMYSFDFLKKLKDIFHCQTIRYTNSCVSDIKRIAICGGSGAFLIEKAISADADIFISSDFKYHDFFLADNKVILADIGHYESEQYTKEIFYELLIEKKPNFAIQFSKVNTNPIKYL